MNCSPTLTSDEFSKIHNGLCSLRFAIDELQNTLHPDLLSKLTKAKEQIYQGLENAYRLDDEAFKNNSKHYEIVSQQHGFKTEWSIDEVTDLYSPHNFHGVTKMIYTNHWGEIKPVSVPINGSQWVDLWKAANECILKSGDDHHIFIEDFHQDGDTLMLSTGS